MKTFYVCWTVVCSLLLCACGENYREFSAEDLQRELDAAAQSPQKVASLNGKFFRLEKPVVLDSRHSGLTIDGGGAAITGAKKISNWRKSAAVKGAWEADWQSAELIPSIFVNGVRAGCSRIPDDTRIMADSSIVETGERYGSRAGMIVSAKDADLFLNLSDAEKRSLYIGTFRNWVQTNTGFKSAQKLKDGRVRVLFSASLDTSMFRNCKYPSFIVFNTLKGLGSAGKFYFDRLNSKIYYMPRKGENMATATVEYPAVVAPFKIAGESLAKARDITIKNAHFKGGALGFENPEKYGADFFMAYGQSAAVSNACVEVSNASGVRFENCKFSAIDSYAILFGAGAENSALSSCELSDLGLGGVKVGIASNVNFYSKKHGVELGKILTKNITVEDCLIYKYGMVSQSGAGILAFDVPECNFVHNEIFDGYYTGISYGWTWGGGITQTRDTNISYNKIHDLCFGSLNDIGGIYTLGKSPNSEIVGNVIKNIECLDYGAWGIYNDEGSAYWLVGKNYVENSSKGGYYMHYGSDCVIKNNIIRGSRDYQFGLGRNRENSYTFTNNIIQYSAPANLFRKKQSIPRKAAKINSNIYYCDGAEVLFGDMNFDQWRKTGQDTDSRIEKIDVDSLLKNRLGVPSVAFEPVDVSRAGVRGKMAERAGEILKNYAYEPMFKHNFKLPQKGIDADFAAVKTGELPPIPAIAPYNKKSVFVAEENGGKFLRVVDTFKDFRPYFFYNFNLPSADFIELEITARFNADSRLRVEIRLEGKFVGSPAMVVANGKICGRKIPLDKWLTIKCAVPTHVNSDKTMRVEVFDSAEKILSFTQPYSGDFSKFDSVFFIAVNGGNGETFDIARIVLKPLQK